MVTGLSRRGFLAGVGGLAVAGAMVGCGGGTPALPDPFRLATGPPGAVYREIGRVIAGVMSRHWPGRDIDVLHTDAAVENLRLLLNGETELALMNIDVAADHLDEVRALARIFDSVVHVVVAEDSPIRDVTDLDGRQVATGLPESGSRFIFDRLATALDIDIDYEDFSQADSVAAFRSGRVDAVVSLTGMPTPAVTELAGGGGVRLLDLGSQQRRLFAQYPQSYLPVVIPGTMYPPLESVNTFAVPTFLAVHRSLDRELAQYLTGIIFDNTEELIQARPEASQINPRTGATTAPVPLHPGAADWFRSHKP